MSWNDPDREDTTIYSVVVNHEEQYSIWPDYKDLPRGWRSAGKTGPKSECLAYIKDVWTDMRPLSLRRRMEEAEKQPQHSSPVVEEPAEPPLVDRLSAGTHPVEVSLRPQKTMRHFEAALNQNYVHIRFTNTRGGTELGVRLDRDSCDFGQANLSEGTGYVHLEGTLSLDYTKVRCVADVQLPDLAGSGHLIKIETQHAEDRA